MFRDELKETLLSIDEEASLLFENLAEPLDVVLVGGGALILRKLPGRPSSYEAICISPQRHRRFKQP